MVPLERWDRGFKTKATVETSRRSPCHFTRQRLTSQTLATFTGRRYLLGVSSPIPGGVGVRSPRPYRTSGLGGLGRCSGRKTSGPARTGLRVSPAESFGLAPTGVGWGWASWGGGSENGLRLDCRSSFTIRGRFLPPTKRP